MANNIPITAGAGTNVATDDVAGVHYQVVKLAAGTEDSATRLVLAESAKGVQAATAVAVQMLKDAGRVAVCITLDTFAIAATAETLMNALTYALDSGTPVTGASSYPVTSGKKFRPALVIASISTVTGNTTVAPVQVRLRVNPAGTPTTSSPIVMTFWLGGTTLANSTPTGCPWSFGIPEGALELSNPFELGVTAACPLFATTTAAPKLTLSIIGYEY